ncbi:hypothetical protein EMPG_10190 [Blastomyces silverae]|uniref:Uncharacterized protein n=1 Tax=Blastomyces silverae TaxID=2060906 RepID=A0A0H1BB20_9EURO|nr:hypothetical protein EMPG_10190 [Blastomyces silverae]
MAVLTTNLASILLLTITVASWRLRRPHLMMCGTQSKGRSRLPSMPTRPKELYWTMR